MGHVTERDLCVKWSRSGANLEGRTVTVVDAFVQQLRPIRVFVARQVAV